jgi:hypothetical protein
MTITYPTREKMKLVIELDVEVEIKSFLSSNPIPVLLKAGKYLLENRFFFPDDWNIEIVLYKAKAQAGPESGGEFVFVINPEEVIDA